MNPRHKPNHALSQTASGGRLLPAIHVLRRLASVAELGFGRPMNVAPPEHLTSKTGPPSGPKDSTSASAILRARPTVRARRIEVAVAMNWGGDECTRRFESAP